MIPLRDIIPSRATPCITVSIVILNAAAWLFELGLPRPALVTLVVFWEIVEVPAVILLGCWVVIQFVSAGAIAVTAAGLRVAREQSDYRASTSFSSRACARS